MKRILTLLLALGLGAGSLSAQQTLEVKRVGLDSLVRFLRNEFQSDIYYIMDEEEQSTFTVSAPRDRFMDAAMDALRDKGYVVSNYGGSRFILHSKTVFTSLPAGYFDDGSRQAESDGLQRYLAEQNTVVTFANNTVQWVLLIGVLLIDIFPTLLWIGIALFAATTFFSLVTLPVEINASQRAVQWMEVSGVVDATTRPMAVDALKWAAYTYIIAALGSLATLFYYISIANNRR